MISKNTHMVRIHMGTMVHAAPSHAVDLGQAEYAITRYTVALAGTGGNDVHEVTGFGLNIQRSGANNRTVANPGNRTGVKFCPAETATHGGTGGVFAAGQQCQ